MQILSDQDSRSFFIHFKLIISLLSHIFITSSLRDIHFNRILCQQTAQDSLNVKLVHKIMSLVFSCAQRLTHMYLSDVAVNCTLLPFSQYCAMCQKYIGVMYLCGNSIFLRS